MAEQSSSTKRHESPADGAVLISGASFAGLSTAYWMTKLGYRVTLIEIAKGLRRGGTPVDIEGETIDALARMGLIEAIRAKALSPRRNETKNADDETIGLEEMDSDGHVRSMPHDENFEIHRDDLLDILIAAVEGSVELMFGRSIRNLVNKHDTVTVTFDDGSSRNYELVFGCDGNRSNTRRLVFGEAQDFSHFLGCYAFIKVVPQTGLLPANVTQRFSVGDRTALLNGYEDRTDLAFAFRSDVELDYDHRDRAKLKQMVRDRFGGLGWKIPAMLAHLEDDDEFYFDKINQIRMSSWALGRVVLVGDAGYCVSPAAGMGGSMAIIGATRLADSLARHGKNHVAAFEEYHDQLQPLVDAVQEQAINEGLANLFFT